MLGERLVTALLLLAFVTRCAAAPSPVVVQNDSGEPDSAEESIRTVTQQLMDALPGDPAVWQRYVSARATYVSEAGDIATKEELLEAFAPFAAGLSGAIRVKTVKFENHGDVAIHVFDAHEKQTVYDQHIEVNYRATHTWRREKGEWRLIAAHNLVLARDPTPVPVAARLADYAGVYDLSGKRRYRVEQRDGVLWGGGENRELVRLIPVGENVFADAGSSLGVIRIFVRNADGAVDRMIQRRKFADTTWMKVPASPDPNSE